MEEDEDEDTYSVVTIGGGISIDGGSRNCFLEYKSEYFQTQ